MNKFPKETYSVLNGVFIFFGNGHLTAPGPFSGAGKGQDLTNGRKHHLEMLHFTELTMMCSAPVP